MARTRAPFSVGRIAFAICFLLAGTALSHASSYTIFDLGSDEGRNIMGIGTDGMVFIDSLSCPPYGSCFLAFNPKTNLTTLLASAPNPSIFDNGSPCTPTGLPSNATASLLHGVCNGGTQAFSGYFEYLSVSDCPPNAPSCIANHGTYRGFLPIP